MDRIDSISIEVDGSPALTGNVLPLLHEIRHALEDFATTGTEHTIDLNSLPLAPQESRQLPYPEMTPELATAIHRFLARSPARVLAVQLEDLLGSGEVRAQLDALGTSEITETAIPGVWRVTHYNGDRVVVGQFLEITDCPAILKSQPQDLPSGVSRLDQLISAYD